MPSVILSDNGVSSGSAGLKSTAASDGALALQTTTAGGTATTAVSIDTSQNVTFTNAANLPNTFGFKNRIINGAMMIDQRNAGASVTPLDTYTVDRWRGYASQSSKYTAQQNAGSVTPPSGYINYLGATSSSAYSVGASDYFAFAQAIEGLNVADLNWGTANAQTVTLSFWVRSSLTGTFGGALINSGYNRCYPFSYTINAANTWEYKTLTIAGDTTGTWLTTNGIGIRVWLSFGAGSSQSGTAGSWQANGFVSSTGATSVVGTNGATFYVTGVQLEKGSTATSFDFRSIGTELALCQRYYEKSFFQTQAVPTNTSQGYAVLGVGSNTYANSQILGHVFYKVVKRTSSPTITIYSYTSSTTGVVSNSASGADLAANSGSVNSITDTGFSVSNGSGAAQTTSSQAVIFNWASSAEI